MQLISANPAGAARWDRLYIAPEQGKQRLFLLVQQLVALRTARGPLVIIIDDVNWMDEESREMLRFLVERIENLPLLMVFIQRPVSGDSWRFPGSRRRFIDPSAATLRTGE